MKGILPSSVFDSFTSRCFAKLVARKRRRTAESKVKVNKKQKRVLPATCRSLEYQETKATVCLEKGQMLSLEGCAVVRLEEGVACMQGYSLTRGVETLVYSSSELCSALTFEARRGSCKLELTSYSLDHAAEDDSPSFKLEVFDGNGESRKRKLEWEEGERRIRPTLISSRWSAAADSLLVSPNPPVVPIAGVKGVGKSTFARYLVNRLLNRYDAVAYLDSDVGQPEFTIPGCLSLHVLKEPIVGPPASHMRVPERCFFYGDTTPKSDPEMYVTYFKALMDSFRENQSEIPLVINLPGWRTGAGYDILVDLLRHATPTHMVEIEIAHERPNALPRTAACPILHVDSVVSELACPGKTAAELRALRVLSYFGASSGGGERFFVSPPFDEAAEALAHQKPYQVRADDFKVLHLHTEVPTSQCLYSLNAQLVGLGISSAPMKGKLVPCAGFGIIRGVDAAGRLLEVITPCSPKVLENVDTLLHGRLDIPAALLEVEGMDDCPYLCRNRVLDGTGSSIFRRGHNILAATSD